VADEVRLWSDELARDPSSLVFLPLAETLRRQGQLDLARKVASRGLERHPQSADAHDQLARIHADGGELQAAFDEWEMVLRLVLAGAYYAPDGNDVAQDVGASLSGVSDEALRATRHLSIGAWRSILFETEAAVVSLSPAPAGGPAAGGLMVVAASPSTPLGL